MNVRFDAVTVVYITMLMYCGTALVRGSAGDGGGNTTSISIDVRADGDVWYMCLFRC